MGNSRSGYGHQQRCQGAGPRSACGKEASIVTLWLARTGIKEGHRFNTERVGRRKRGFGIFTVPFQLLFSLCFHFFLVFCDTYVGD